MRRLLISLLLVASAARADDLGDANTFLMAKQYAKALPLYTKLAAAGNPEAQFRLGEMYWYGDGTPQDLDAARAWIGKAAAAGVPDAAESLAILERRKLRGGEIAYWMTQYRGEELQAGRFGCPTPAIPALSRTNAEIAATDAAFQSWQTCYNGFVENLNAAMPPGKVIPPDVLDMMSPSEFERVRLHIESVYSKMAADAQAHAARTIAQRDGWNKATQDYVKQENLRRARQRELETARVVADQEIRMPTMNENRSLDARR